jgi:hypothetical protein
MLISLRSGAKRNICFFLSHRFLQYENKGSILIGHSFYSEEPYTFILHTFLGDCPFRMRSPQQRRMSSGLPNMAVWLKLMNPRIFQYQPWHDFIILHVFVKINCRYFIKLIFHIFICFQLAWESWFMKFAFKSL